MAVQATGAMAIVIADVPAVHSADDPARALFTLSLLTGIVMLAAGFLRLGSVLRFVSNALMVGFISAVGVNIIQGQLANLTGYKAEGANRVVRAIKRCCRRYAYALVATGSKLVIVSASERIQEQLRVAGVTDLIGRENIYSGDERIGATVKCAYADGTAWIEQNQRGIQTDAR
jgi:MFS superfamily sulfate permease-like transporter